MQDLEDAIIYKRTIHFTFLKHDSFEYLLNIRMCILQKIGNVFILYENLNRMSLVSKTFEKKTLRKRAFIYIELVRQINTLYRKFLYLELYFNFIILNKFVTYKIENAQKIYFSSRQLLYVFPIIENYYPFVDIY